MSLPAEEYNRKVELLCGDCGAQAVLRDSAILYAGRSFGPVWMCPNFPTCNCYVGCHPMTTKPLGTLANKETREWRKQAHSAFDALWLRKLRGPYRRATAYAKISKAFERQVHIGESGPDDCRAIIDWSRAELKKLKEKKNGKV